MFLKSILLTVAVSLIAASANSQNFSYANVSVETVTFLADLTIKEDNGSFYGTPQWDKGATQQIPVAYASGDVPFISALLTIDCDNVPDSIMIRGIAPDGMEFPGIKVEVQPSGSTIHDIAYPSTAASIPFTAGTIRYFNPFKIGWDVSFDEGVSWRPADTSSNKLYVTLNNPM